jgi:hypothetical protein
MLNKAKKANNFKIIEEIKNVFEYSGILFAIFLNLFIKLLKIFIKTVVYFY